MNGDELRQAALVLVGQGLRIAPVGNAKRPVGKWGQLLDDSLPDAAQIDEWVNDNRVHGWAVLCGHRDDGVACLDIEAAGMGVPEVAGATLRAPTYCQYVSASGGVHVWVKVTGEPLVTEPLASLDTGDADPEKRWTLLAEVRGVSKPGSHRRGAYAVVVGPGRPPLRQDFRPGLLTRDESDEVVLPIRQANQKVRVEKPPKPVSASTSTGVGTAYRIGQAVADGTLSALEVLPDGWEVVGHDGRREMIRRPGATSPTSGNVLDGVFVIHSTAVDWADAGEPMSAAAVLAHARHGGNWHAAMRAVEDAAAGDPSPYSSWPAPVLQGVADDAAERRRRFQAHLDGQVQAWLAPAASPPSQSSPQSRHVSETDETAETDKTGPRLWSGDELQPSQPTRWLVRGQLPLSQVAVLIGDEGIGKSLWWVLMVAHITTGTGDDLLGIPPAPPRDVVLVLTEDSWTTDVRPRLEAAGADLGRVHVLAEDDDGSGSPYFPRDFPIITGAADELDVALVVIDAWLDTVQSGLQVKDPQQARQALHPWRSVAQTTGACVLLLAHSNRADDGSLRNRVGATGALRQKARVLLYAARPPEQDDILFIGADKANGTARANATAYRLDVQQVRPETDDDPGTIARLLVIGDTGATIESHYSLWRAEAHRAEHPNADERAWQWLRTHLDAHGVDSALGRQVGAAETKAAAQAAGHNPQRLAGVVKAHGGYAGPDGAGGRWVYRVHSSGGPTLTSAGQSSQTSQSGQSQKHGETETNTATPDEPAAPMPWEVAS